MHHIHDAVHVMCPSLAGGRVAAAASPGPPRRPSIGSTNTLRPAAEMIATARREASERSRAAADAYRQRRHPPRASAALPPAPWRPSSSALAANLTSTVANAAAAAGAGGLAGAPPGPRQLTVRRKLHMSSASSGTGNTSSLEVPPGSMAAALKPGSTGISPRRPPALRASVHSTENDKVGQCRLTLTNTS